MELEEGGGCYALGGRASAIRQILTYAVRILTYAEDATLSGEGRLPFRQTPFSIRTAYVRIRQHTSLALAGDCHPADAFW